VGLPDRKRQTKALPKEKRKKQTAAKAHLKIGRGAWGKKKDSDGKKEKTRAEKSLKPWGEEKGGTTDQKRTRVGRGGRG